MKPRLIAAVSIASLLLAAPALSQSQLPRPGQLPPAGGQGAPPPQRGPAAPPQQHGRRRGQALQAGVDHRARGRGRSELRGVPQAARRGRREEGPQGAGRPRRAELLLDGREGRQGRQEEARHRKSRQGDPARRQGGAGLGAARRCRRRSDRHAVSGPQGHDLRTGRPDLQCAGARGTRQGDRHRGRRLGLSDPNRPRGARRARSPTRRWSRSSACTSSA